MKNLLKNLQLLFLLGLFLAPSLGHAGDENGVISPSFPRSHAQEEMEAPLVDQPSEGRGAPEKMTVSTSLFMVEIERVHGVYLDYTLPRYKITVFLPSQTQIYYLESNEITIICLDGVITISKEVITMKYNTKYIDKSIQDKPALPLY